MALPNPMPEKPQELVDDYSREDLDGFATLLGLTPEDYATKADIASAIVDAFYAAQENVASLPMPIPTKDALMELGKEALADIATHFALKPKDYANKSDMADAIIVAYRQRYPFVAAQQDYEAQKAAGTLPPRDPKWRDWPQVLTPQPVPGVDESLCKSCVESCKAPHFATRCGRYRTRDGLLPRPQPQ